MRKIINLDGILVLYNHNRVNKSTYARFGILTGSFNEKIPGTAHFLEHMLFKQTKNRSHEQLQEDMLFLGINAETGHDDMQIIFSQSSRLLEKCFEVCSDMFFNSIITKEYMDKERKVIEEEILRNASNNSRILSSKHYGKVCNKAYGNIGGTVKSIKDITPEILEEFKRENFCKENFYISISSNKPLWFIKKLIKKYISPNLSSNPNFKGKHLVDYDFKNTSFVQLESKDSQKNNLLLSFNTLNKDLRQVYILSYINYVLFRTNASRFRNALREQKSLIYAPVSPSSVINNSQKLWGLSLETSSQNIKPCIEEIFKVLQNIKNNGITEKEYNNILEFDKYSRDNDIPSPVHRPLNMLKAYKSWGKFISPRYDAKLFYSIKLEEINELCKKLFDIKKVCLTVIGNATKKDIPTLKELNNLIKKYK